jgi:endonuclease YncB( thermonuclease family)
MAAADGTSPDKVKNTAKGPDGSAKKLPPQGAAKAAAAANKYAQAAALPDATLTDDEASEGDIGGEEGGFKTWLQPARRRWILLGTAVTGLLILVAVTVVAAAYRKAPTEDAGSDVIAGPAQVIDGGTVIVAGQTLQLEAIDAPPISLMCRDGAYQYRCGDDARRALAYAIGNGPVECVHAQPRSDGRLAALCRNDTGLDVAAIQVESGWAVNDLKKSSRYIAEELRARNNGKGLWRNDFAHPELWRDAAGR